MHIQGTLFVSNNHLCFSSHHQIIKPKQKCVVDLKSIININCSGKNLIIRADRHYKFTEFEDLSEVESVILQQMDKFKTETLLNAISSPEKNVTLHSLPSNLPTNVSNLPKVQQK